MYSQSRNERLQAALQLSCGMLLLLQFSLWDVLRFKGSCAAPVLYVVVSLLAPPSCDVGSKFSTGIFIIGPQLLGIAAAGIVGTAGRLLLPNNHVLIEAGSSVAILAVLSVVRVNSDVLARYQALLTAMYYGNVLLAGMAASGVQLFWRHTVLPWVAVAATAVLASLLVSLLVLPSLASEKVEQSVSSIAVSLAHHLSSCSSYVMASPSDQLLFHPDLAAAVDILQLAEEELTQAQVAEALYVRHHTRYNELLTHWWLHHSRPPGERHPATAEATNAEHQQNEQHIILNLWPWGCQALQAPWAAAPSEGCGVATPADHAASMLSHLQWSQSFETPLQMPQMCFEGPPIPQLVDLSGQLRQAKQLLQAAYVEPSCLRRARGVFDTSWGQLLKATELLMSRLSALEVYITHARSLQGLYGSNLPTSSKLLECFSQTYALAAATTAGVGQSLMPRHWPTRQLATQSTIAMVAASAAMSSELQVLRQELWLSLQQVYEEHWQQVLAACPAQPVTLLPFHQVNAVYGAFVSACSLVDAATGLAAAAQAVLVARRPCDRRPANFSHVSGGRDGQQPLLEPHQSSAGSCGDDGDQGMKLPSDCSTAQTASSSHKEHLSWWLAYLLCTAQFQQLMAAATSVKGACCSWSGFHTLISRRAVQAGFKFFLVATSVLISLMVVLHAHPQLTAAGLGFGYTAAVSGITCRIESTASQVFVRTCSTIAGGAAGYLLMSTPLIQGSPLLLSCVLFVVALVFGSLNRHRWRSLILYTLMMMISLAACQLGSHPGAVSTGDVFKGKLSSVLFGAGVAAAVGHLLLPWSTADWALETLAHDLVTAAEMMAEVQNSIYSNCQQAWQSQQQQASSDACPVPPPAAGSSNGWSISAESSRLLHKLHQQLLPSLLAVRASLVVDNTVWNTGPLAVPQRVNAVLWGLTLLVESLLAWTTSLSYMTPGHWQPPPSGQQAEQDWDAALAQLYQNHLQPTQHVQQQLLQTAQGVVAATSRLLLQKQQATGSAAEEVKEQLETFNKVRLNVAQARRHQREAHYAAQHAQGSHSVGQQGALQALLYGQGIMHSNWVMDGVALVARCALAGQQ